MHLASLKSLALALAVGLPVGPALASDWMDDKPAKPPAEKRAPAPVEEDSGAKKMKLGADFALVIPTGDWSDLSGIGLGALLRFEYRVADNVAITARVGYIGHLSVENSTGFGTVSSSTSEMPLLFPGIKAIFGGAYVAAELGLINLGVSAEIDDEAFGSGEVSDSEMKFGLTLGVGYEISDVDLRLSLFAPSLEDFGDFLGIMVNVGYNFLKF